jgi:hypothetical protein
MEPQGSMVLSVKFDPVFPLEWFGSTSEHEPCQGTI